MLTLVILLCIGMMGLAWRLQAVQRELRQFEHDVARGDLVKLSDLHHSRGWMYEAGKPETLRPILAPHEAMTAEEFAALDIPLVPDPPAIEPAMWPTTVDVDAILSPGRPLMVCKHGSFKYGQCADCLSEERP
jgi:hypothetical protein